MGIHKAIAKNKQSARDWLKAQSVRYFGDIIRVDLPGSIAADNRRLCLFAHYSADGCFADFLFSYVDALKQAKCDVVIISTAPDFAETDRAKLFQMGVGLVQRRNVGYDFGSWCTGLKVVPGVRQYKTIIFANDSVYGPFADLGAIIESMEEQELDLWAMTASLERCPHIQTYFWAISNRGISGGFLEYFWFVYYRYYSIRQRVIDRYELRVQQMAEEQFGLKVGAYVGIEKLFTDSTGETGLRQSNPLQHCALRLLQEFNFPFVKRELLLADPFKLQVEDELDDLLSSKAPKLWRLAKAHIAELRRKI